MKKAAVPILVAVILLTVAVVTEAQQPTKIPRIGYLTAAGQPGMASRTETFRQGLRDLGYVEGKNIVVEWRFADGKADQLPGLVAELIALKVDLIVSAGPGVTRVAKPATSTIPIVMAFDNDPVGSGFVASLAHPGGNITGLSTIEPELNGKRLDLLKEILPRLARVAYFGTSTNPGLKAALKEAQRAAKAAGIVVQYIEVSSFQDIESGYRAVTKQRAEAALMNISGPINQANRKAIVDLELKYRLPVMHDTLGPVDAGGLMFYGVNLSDMDRRAATYVDKILKGRSPAELPVEQPTKFEFVINLKTAKQIGLTIPPVVLARATTLIK
jgi:putative tryptophan/tyrosine transport system substrate-binding protein